MKTLHLFLLLALFVLTPVFADEPEKHSVMPKNGFIPDKETAIKIAEAIWLPIYGEATINKERPFNATLLNGVWIVEGSLPKGFVSGVAIVEISKQDGRIIRVSHGK